MKDLSSHILDIVQNSIRAKARLVEIEVAERPNSDELEIAISDDGKGMTKEEAERATDPFYTSRTTRKVGLGLSLFKQNAEMTGGSFCLESEPGKGTKVVAVFGLRNIDRPAMGDLSGTLLLLICSPERPEYAFRYRTANGTFELDTREISEILGDVPFTNPEIRKFLKEMIEGNLEQIQISE